MTLAEPTTKPYTSLVIPGVHAGSDEGFRRLSKAVVIQALYDARYDSAKGRKAREWLVGEDCGIFCEFTNINQNAVKEWVSAGCPDWRKPADEI